MKRITIVSILVFILLAGLTLAQDEEWTCDGGPNDIVNAAQAAYDNDDLETAWRLAAHAELLCINDTTWFRQAQQLRRRLGRHRDILEMLATAGPGKVNIGDYELSMNCVGEGSPTIIFENGLGMGSILVWGDVLPAMSTVTRACRYDRLGLVPSDYVPVGMVRTTQNQVDDLAILLEIAEIEPPYVLVGHSIAGINILLFVDQYPDLVEGIVLVDASHPDQFNRWAEADPEVEAPVVGVPVPPEQIDFATSFAQAAGIQDFGDRPLAVVTAGIGSDAIWMELQEEFASYSTNSRHVIAEHSNHLIMDREPELVIEAILWVLNEVRAAEESE